MKRKLALLLVTLAMGYAYSQDYSFTPGNVTSYEMTMIEYDKDKKAEAIVIYEFGDYRFLVDKDERFKLHKNKKIKLKILKQAGIDYATFEIPIYQKGRTWEELKIEKATVYNIDDQQRRTTELDLKKIYEEKLDNDWIIKKFTMPDIKEGSVIELEYTIITPYYFNMGTWNFQKRIPVIYSRLRYLANPFYEYVYIMKGANKFAEQSSKVLPNDVSLGRTRYQEVEFIFGMRNIPAFKDEEFVTTAKDYMISLDFQLSKTRNFTGGVRNIMTTWTKLCQEFLKDENFGKYIKKSEAHAVKTLKTLPLSGLSPLEQVKEITNYVKSTYNWNGYNGKYAIKSFNDFMKDKTGNAANLNLFLIGLLQAAKIDVSPVLLSTRTSGSVSKFHPFEKFFNYVIAMVKIDNTVLFIDATEPLLSPTKLPERCINVEGLIVNPKVEQWVLVQQVNNAIAHWDFRITPFPAMKYSIVEITSSRTGPYAYQYRKIYDEGEEKFLNYLNKTYNINPENINTSNVRKLELPFIFSFNANIDLESHDDKIFVMPFCNLSLSDNPFKQTERTLPVDLIYARGDIYNTTITIPEGYKVNFLPSDIEINDTLVFFQYSTQATENIITISARYNLKKDIYPAGEYIALKNRINTIIQKLSEIIVLEKE
ncbi:MAG: DUF3857 domain-containing protein [Firmicutes bacterium]|nr:DUF3857 domain-containing protein [Bacillota bacterium]